jgi:SAM-dependent methyltransferase
MHEQARAFTVFVKQHIPGAFQNKHVLDVGSGDINGNNRFLFEGGHYEGNDVYAATNVTIVSKTTALPFQPQTFDTIVSTECFEHDPEYADSFRKIVSMLKDGGLFCFTCASTGRAEHGTRRTTPQDSYGTIGNVDGWTDYYKNLTFEDLDAAINVRNTFSDFRAYYNAESKDLYFWGIKKGADLYDTSSVPAYRANGILCTSH